MTGAAPARCFVAVAPPPQLVSQLEALERPARPGLRWTGPANWHVTLRFLAKVDPAALVAAVGSIGPGRALASCGPSPFRLSPRVWALPVDGLDALAAAVGAATAGLEEEDGRRFRGHLTLARARVPAALGGLPASAVHCAWEVEEVLVVESRLGSGGARHTVLAQCAL